MHRKLTIAVAAIVAGLLILPMVAAIGALAAPPTTVTIAGQVILASGFTVTLQAHARGASGSLSGGGIDSTFHGNPLGFPPGTCVFPLTGSVLGTVVTLSGTVSKSTDSSLLGASVHIVADAATGGITFTFAGAFILTGTGTVVINNP